MRTPILILGLCAGFCSCANILGVFPMPIFSHMNGYRPIFEELARRGHNVTVVSPFPRKEPLANYTDIELENSMPSILRWGNSMMSTKTVNQFSIIILGHSYYCYVFLDPLFTNSKLLNFIKEDRSHFDLVILETFFCQEPFAALAHKYSAHLITLHGLMLGSREAYYTGNTLPYSYVPHKDMVSSDHMSFWERAYSSLFHFTQLMLNHFLFEPTLEKYMRDFIKYEGSENLPPLEELLKNQSLIMLDHHTSLSFPRPYLPNVIEFGGITTQKALVALQKDLEEFMSSAEDGVIVLSWGSYFRSSTIDREIVEKFLSVFSKLKQKVLMKWEDPVLPGKPDNVKISEWFPQTSVLAHPKVVLFISHCGTHGLNEGTYYGVPILGTPLFADQFQNAKVTVKAGYGIYLNIFDFSEEYLLESIQKLIHDPSYKKAAIRHSNVMKDRPLSPLDNAIYWIEYVLRHDGARHLRPASLDLAWYQYFLLDIIALILLSLVLLVFIAVYLFRFIYYKVKTLLAKSKRKKD